MPANDTKADDGSEYRTTRGQALECDETVGGCGRTFTGRVSIHRRTGVAGVTCPHCGTTQEPKRKR